MENVDRPTTRRSLLAAAAGGVAALAAQAVIPLTASAADGGPVVLGEFANTATHVTGIDTSATADVDAFSAKAGGTGMAVVAISAGGSAVAAHNTSGTGSAVVATCGVVGAGGPAVAAASSNEAGVYATSVTAGGAAPASATTFTGVYGYAPVSDDQTIAGAGVWGDSGDIGVVGTGGLGVLGDGNIGVEGDGSGTGGVGVLGWAGGPGTVGVYAQADSNDRTALKVKGKVAFSRSGRSSIATGRSSKVVLLPGVTTGSLIFAMLSSNRSGRWVRAVVPAAGKFTVYLNTTVPGTTYVVWWIIN
jgi:hypothetical protein